MSLLPFSLWCWCATQLFILVLCLAVGVTCKKGYFWKAQCLSQQWLCTWMYVQYDIAVELFFFLRKFVILFGNSSVKKKNSVSVVIFSITSFMLSAVLTIFFVIHRFWCSFYFDFLLCYIIHLFYAHICYPNHLLFLMLCSIFLLKFPLSAVLGLGSELYTYLISV